MFKRLLNWYRERRFERSHGIMLAYLSRGKGTAFRLILDRELRAIVETAALTEDHRDAEVLLLEGKLMRRFDPSPIWNDAINRAIEGQEASA